MIAELLVFQMCAICLGFDGHICPVYDGEMQHWNCDVQWTVIVIPNSLEWYSSNLGYSVYGEWFSDMYGIPTMVIGLNKIKDEFGYSVFTHEARHLQCMCNWH